MIRAILLAGFLLPFVVFAEDDPVKAGVAASIDTSGDTWSGQQVTLNLDLKTTGFSFSNAHFNLPEVSGAFLMQTDTTTIKLSENAGGKTWQVLRYPLALYPQRSGQLDIPSIAVRFTTSSGYGSAEKSFEFQTEPLQLTVKSPPGVKEGDLVISTTSFKLEYDWQPESGTARSGDAFTLTVTRRANDISGMLLPPLPIFQVNGLAAYPQAPQVSDKTDRGDLTGERIDSIIWVIEKPGTYNIPGIRFQWWDPGSRELNQQIIPGLDLDVLPSPGDSETAVISAEPAQTDNNHLWLLAAILAVMATVFLWLRFGSGKVRTSRQSEDTEESSLARLKTACKTGQPAQAYSAIYAWLTWYSTAFSSASRQLTLTEFARVCNDPSLDAELDQLQEALVHADNNWQGDQLLASLLRVRREIKQQKTTRSTAQLAPLNP